MPPADGIGGRSPGGAMPGITHGDMPEGPGGAGGNGAGKPGGGAPRMNKGIGSESCGTRVVCCGGSGVRGPPLGPMPNTEWPVTEWPVTEWPVALRGVPAMGVSARGVLGDMPGGVIEPGGRCGVGMDGGLLPPTVPGRSPGAIPWLASSLKAACGGVDSTSAPEGRASAPKLLGGPCGVRGPGGVTGASPVRPKAGTSPICASGNCNGVAPVSGAPGKGRFENVPPLEASRAWPFGNGGGGGPALKVNGGISAAGAGTLAFLGGGGYLGGGGNGRFAVMPGKAGSANMPEPPPAVCVGGGKAGTPSAPVPPDGRGGKGRGAGTDSNVVCPGMLPGGGGGKAI